MTATNPFHMDPDGSWWFYSDPTCTGRYGPYLTPEIAQQKFGEYQAWVHSQSAEAQAAQAADPATNVESLVSEYIASRDEKSAMAERHKNEMAPLTQAMELIENRILDALQKAGVKSMSTGAGVAMVSTTDYYKVADKQAYGQYLLQSGLLELTGMKISPTAMKEWRDNNPDQLPPGIKVTTERGVSIRRK